MMQKRTYFTAAVLTAIVCFYHHQLVLAAPGDLDPTFGSGGIAIHHVMNIGHYWAPSTLLLQPDGKILVSGEIDEYADLTGFFIARFQQDGSRDLSFGNQGMILVREWGNGIGAYIALRPDGKIVAVGHQGDSGEGAEIVVQRLSPEGEPDPAFGVGGSTIFTPPGMDAGRVGAVALQPDGKIVIVGNTWLFSQGNSPGLIVRLNADGSFDDGFGTGGIVTVSRGYSWERFRKVLIQPNGKLVAISEFAPDANSNTIDLGVQRFNADGSVDSSFGTNGAVTLSRGSADNFTGAAIQHDGKVIVSSRTNAPEYAASWIRYNTDGSIDTDFSADAVSTSYFNPHNFALQQDGKIVAFGSTPTGSASFGISVTRLHPNGSIDTTFGTNGRTVTSVGTHPYYTARNGVIQPDGKILVLGKRGDYNVYEIAIARYLGNPSFSVSGRVVTATGQGIRNATVALTDALGIVRTETTSSFGVFNFNGVAAGQNCTLTVRSKRYRFSPRPILVTSELTGVELVGQE